jgi:hypothetical protein
MDSIYLLEHQIMEACGRVICVYFEPCHKMKKCGRLQFTWGDKISRYYTFSRRKVWYQSPSQPRILVIQPVAGHLNTSVIPTLILINNMQEAFNSVTEHAKEM